MRAWGQVPTEHANWCAHGRAAVKGKGWPVCCWAATEQLMSCRALTIRVRVTLPLRNHDDCQPRRLSLFLPFLLLARTIKTGEGHCSACQSTKDVHQFGRTETVHSTYCHISCA